MAEEERTICADCIMDDPCDSVGCYAMKNRQSERCFARCTEKKDLDKRYNDMFMYSKHGSKATRYKVNRERRAILETYDSRKGDLSEQSHNERE